MLGVTWAATLDAALDEIARLQKDKADADLFLTRFCDAHPRVADDEDLALARLALQR